MGINLFPVLLVVIRVIIFGVEELFNSFLSTHLISSDQVCEEE